MRDFEQFRTKRGRERCLAAIERACGSVPPGIDLTGLGLDALMALEKVFDAIRGATRAARLYKRLVDAQTKLTIPEDAPGIVRAIMEATGKPVPHRLKRDLPKLDPATCRVLETALRDLTKAAKDAREKRRARA